MITSVKIETFRGVREGGVDGLAPISILVGPNNTGKSTVLEAIAVAGLAPDAHAVAEIVLRRGGPALDALARVVRQGAERASVIVQVVIAGQAQEQRADVSAGGNKKFEWSVEARQEGLQDPMDVLSIGTPQGGRSVVLVDASGRRADRIDLVNPIVKLADSFRFVDVEAVRGRGALEDAYTLIDEAGQLAKIVKALSRAMPSLTDLRILKVGQDFLLHTFFSSGPPVPAYLAGDGFKRFLELAAAALNVRKGIVLLEEPESFQHPRYLEELATLLHLAAKEGTQVVLSTHSVELIDLLLQAPEAEGLAYPAVHRLRLVEGKLRATTIDRESAVIGRRDLLEDLRA